MQYKYLLSTILFVLIFTSCTNNSPEDLIENTQIIGQLRYNQNIKPIIDNNCISCHGVVPTNGAPISLVNYTQVKDSYLNNGLLDRIQRQNGDGLLMPQGGPRLPQNTIDVFVQWNADGLLE